MARLSHKDNECIDNDQYRILHKIRSGGMGTVYRAQDTVTDTHYAVKECDLLDDPRGKSMPRETAVKIFIEEARGLEKLNHPSIPRGFIRTLPTPDLRLCLQCGHRVEGETCTICQVGQNSLYYEPQQIDKRYYLFMEYVEGSDINRISHSFARPLDTKDLSRVCHWIAETAAVLRYIHGLKLAHCDVKPENLRERSHDGRLFLLDFGLIQPEQSSRNSANLAGDMKLGSPGYASPEQAKGQPGYGSDIYALCVTGLQLLTGLDPTIANERAQLEGPYLCRDHKQVRNLVICLQEGLTQQVYQRPTLERIQQLAEEGPALSTQPLGQVQQAPDLTKPQSAAATRVLGQDPPKSASDPSQNLLQQPIHQQPLHASTKDDTDTGSLDIASQASPSPLPKLIAIGVVLAMTVIFAFLWSGSGVRHTATAQPNAMICEQINGNDCLILKNRERLLLTDTSDEDWLKVLRINDKSANGYIRFTEVSIDRNHKD